MFSILSKTAKRVILFNFILLALIFIMHTVNYVKIQKTEAIIEEFMIERNVDREDAIFLLQEEGVELFLGSIFATFTGYFVTISSGILLYRYYKNHNFLLGMFTGIVCVFANFLGGVLLLLVILSGKGITKDTRNRVSLKTDWERFIHGRVDT